MYFVKSFITPLCKNDAVHGASTVSPSTSPRSATGADGTLTIGHEDSPDEFSVVDNVITAKGARTIAIDEKTHHVLLVTAEF